MRLAGLGCGVIHIVAFNTLVGTKTETSPAAFGTHGAVSRTFGLTGFGIVISIGFIIRTDLNASGAGCNVIIC